MMEELSDETNGESTFEFVGGKNDENNLTDFPLQDNKGDVPTVPFYPTPLTSHPHYTPMQSQSESTAPAKDYGIQFYDPAQYGDPKPLPMTQFPMPVEAQQQQSPPVATIPQQEYTSPLQFSPPVTSVQQSAPWMEHGFQMSYTDPWNKVTPGDPESTQINPAPAENGVWGWIKNRQFLNKVAEKAKSSVDSVITTLDPGMKEIINSGGDINIIVASGSQPKVSAVREAFQLVFGKATVEGIDVQATSIAPQPVGFSAGLKATEERISNLRQRGILQDNQVVLAVENFLVELTPENWYDMGCLFLQDFHSNISLQVYTEAIPVSSHYVSQAKDQTPLDYPLGWSGHAITIGQIIGGALGVHHSEWHEAATGVSRREILFLAAKTVAGLYKKQLGR